MDNDIHAWLLDIKNCIDEIFSFLPKKRDFFEFQADIKTRKAVERNIEIIGEAMKRILNKKPDFPIANARKIVDTRNRVSHGYDSVSDDIIWAIIVRDIPKLGKEVNSLLRSQTF